MDRTNGDSESPENAEGFDPGGRTSSPRILVLTVPSVAHQDWWVGFADRVQELRDEGYRIVTESDLIAAPVREGHLQRIQSRLNRHANRVASALSPRGCADSSHFRLQVHKDDIVVATEVTRLGAWRWWNIAAELPLHLLFLSAPLTADTALKREWLDSANRHAKTRVVRADMLSNAATGLCAPVVILASPRLADFLTSEQAKA